MPKKRVRQYFLLVTFAFLNILIWFFVFYTPHKLTVTFLNVGQGDAILIESPTGVQMLIDGGRDRSVLRELPKRMGPLDRTIDVVVATHPDADHIGGLAEVFARYSVGYFMASDVASDTNTAAALASGVAHEKGVVTVPARRGTRILLGGGAYADILFPDRNVSGLETNTGSIVMRVVYKDTSFMLTGDAPSSIEDWLITLDTPQLPSDVLKAGHHGSRTSTSEKWLAVVDPDVVVVSAGKDNSYGHPHAEVLERVETSGARILSTTLGAVTFVSDGEEVTQK